MTIPWLSAATRWGWLFVYRGLSDCTFRLPNWRTTLCIWLGEARINCVTAVMLPLLVEVNMITV